MLWSFTSTWAFKGKGGGGLFGQLLNQRSKRTSKSIKTKKKQKAARILKGEFQKKRDRFNPEKNERGGRGGGLICLGFFQKCVFQTKCEALFFVTFNNILSHVFPENFIEFPQIVQKIWIFSLSILIIFIIFFFFFFFFDIFTFYKEAKDFSI